jgi:putative peptidoglycan lipid II flippase
MTYSLGLLSFMQVKILAPGYYARQDTHTPVRFALIAIAVNMGFNLVVVVPMILLKIPAPHAALALATTVAGYVNVWQLYHGLRRDGVYQPRAGWGSLVGRLAAANGVMALLLVVAVPGLAQWAAWGAAQRVVHLALWIGAAMATYVVVLRIVGVDLRDLVGRHQKS